MTRRGLAALLALGALTAHAQPVQVTDDAGRTVRLAQPARRIVTLSPGLAEMVHAAGAGAQLVGVMRFSDFPPAVKALPVVGDATALNYEAIARLQPDLVLVWGSGLNDRAKARLADLGAPLYESETRSVEDLATTLERLGTLSGHAAEAGAAASALRERWRALGARYAGRQPVRVFYQLWHEPLMTVNGQHLIHQAIAACGGINAFATQPVLVPTIGWEAAVKSDPQLVVTSGSPEEPARLAPWKRFPQVSAVRQGQLVVLDGHALARLSPRFLDAAGPLCEAIDRARR